MFHETRDRNVVMSGVSEGGLTPIVYKERGLIRRKQTLSLCISAPCMHPLCCVCVSCASVCVCSANRFYIKAIKGCRNKWETARAG